MRGGPEEVAAVLSEELDALEVREVWDRLKETCYGYVEPGEAADQTTEEVLAPFLGELAKHQKLGIDTDANRMCMEIATGVVLVPVRVHLRVQGLGTRCADHLCRGSGGCVEGRRPEPGGC